MDFSASALLEGGKLVNLFPDWSDELFPLYLYHPSRRFVPAKLRIFSEFVVSSLNPE
jgi:DNA-binding transcriptional LysR family regulator